MHRGKIDAAGNRTHVVVPCHVTSTRAGKGCVGSRLGLGLNFKLKAGDLSLNRPRMCNKIK